MTGQDGSQASERPVTYDQAESIYQINLAGANERYAELTDRDLSARSAAILRERGEFDPENRGHRLVAAREPLSAAERLELMAIGEVLARYYRHPTMPDYAANWPSLASRAVENRAPRQGNRCSSTAAPASSRSSRTRLRLRSQPCGRRSARLIRAATMSGSHGEMMAAASNRSRHVPGSEQGSAPTRSPRRSPGTIPRQSVGAPGPGTGPGLKCGLIHPRPEPFTDGRARRIRAGHGRRRPVVNIRQQYWKACRGQPLASSNLASPARLTNLGRMRNPGGDLVTGRSVVLLPWKKTARMGGPLDRQVREDLRRLGIEGWVVANFGFTRPPCCEACVSASQETAGGRQ